MSSRRSFCRDVVVVVGLVAALSGCTEAAHARRMRSSAVPAPAVAVDPKGNDSTCARMDISHPCLTFSRAYVIAKPGDVVRVDAGRYPAQTLLRDPTKVAADLSNVVFVAAPGQHPVVDEIDFGSRTGSVLAPADHVTIDGIDIARGAFLLSERTPGTRPSFTTLENMHIGLPNATAIYAENVFHFTLRNVDIGPLCCNDDAIDIFGSDPQSSYVTFDHVRVHDVATSCSGIPPPMYPDCAATSDPFAGNHVDCLQMLGGDHITIVNSQFVNCNGAGTWENGILNGTHYWDILVENSMFQGHVLSLTCGGPTCGGDYAVLAADPKTGQRAYVKFFYNTIVDGMYFQDWQPGGDYEIVGNISYSPPDDGCTIPSTWATGASFTLARYNLFSRDAGSCGPTNRAGEAAFVNVSNPQAGIDLHLRRGSAGIAAGDPDLHPRTDIDGQQRPLAWRPDIGADQQESAEIVLGDSIGAARIGMGMSELTAAYGAPASVVRRRAPGGPRVSVASYRRPWGTVAVTYSAEGRVVGVATTSPYYTTPAGVGSGFVVPGDGWLSRTFPATCGRARRRQVGSVSVDVVLSRGGRSRHVISISMARTRYAARCA